MATGYMYHEVFGWHDTGTAAGLLPSDPRAGLQPWHHLDEPASKTRMHELIVVSGLADRLKRLVALPATDEQILRVHDRSYLDRLRSASDASGGDAGDGISPFGRNGLDIMRLAAGGAIAAVDAVLDGIVDNAYALVRPSGHHALPDRGMGMAYLGNTAIAVQHAVSARGVERVAVVDWDVHHGNGTQQAFATSSTVLTVSVHQENCFPPGNGSVDEQGEGAGKGFIVNVPLPPGTGDGGYQHAFERVVIPALERFRPDLIVVASGLDASVMDPLGRQMVTSAGFRDLTRQIMDVAERLCGGRVVMVHEGGYASAYLPFCGLAIVEELSGERTLPDPYLDLVSGFGGQSLQPHQRAIIAEVASAVGL